MKDFGYAKGYQWSKGEGKTFTNLDFLPNNLKGTTYYEPPKR